MDRTRGPDERAEAEFRRGASLLNQGRVSEAEESFAAALAICNINVLEPKLARTIADVLMVILLIVFGMRLAKTKKFMPAGMMLIVTLAALVLRHV